MAKFVLEVEFEEGRTNCDDCPFRTDNGCCDISTEHKLDCDKQIGKRNGYFRKYNMKHPERYDRVGIDLEFEKWKAEYYRESSCFGKLPPVTIVEEELYRQYKEID